MKKLKLSLHSGLIVLAVVCFALTGCNSGSSGNKSSNAGTSKFAAVPAKMNVARAKVEATPLPDGRILITGGYKTSPNLSHASAEIFDPVAQKFTLTGAMNERRQCHNAVALPDGTVLVVGGNNETGASLTSAEVYDPATGLFTQVDSMAAERTCAMSTLLPNGTVLVAGGYDTAGTFLDTAEIYDPRTQTFGPLLQMHHARSCHAQVLMRNGLVLMTTGCAATEHAELFDWKDNSFTVIDDLSTQRKYPFFALLNDGRVLIAGGNAAGKEVKSAEIYTPSYSGGKGTFALTAGKLTTGRWRGACGILPNGKVLLAGGAKTNLGGTTRYLDTAEIFDPAINRFTDTYKMSSARGNWPRFLMTKSGYGVVFGGIRANGEASATCDKWKISYPKTKAFDSVSAMMSDYRAKLEATHLPDGKILITGGYKTTRDLSHYSAEIFDPVYRTLTTTGSMIDRRQCHNAVALPDGTILVVGGNNETGVSLTSAEIYNPVTGQFTLVGSMAAERTCAMSTLLPNGKVLVVGGYDTAGTFLDTAEIYDPLTLTFGPLLQMNHARSCHAQVLLKNGLVLMTTGCAATEHAELFDWRDNSFTVIDDLSTQRKYPFFAQLKDGRVLIAGGSAGGIEVDTAEIYTPSLSGGNGSFTLVANGMSSGPGRGACGVLPGGKVLLLGGAKSVIGGGTEYLDTAEIFNPANDTFTGDYKMSSARGNWPRFLVTKSGYGVIFGGIDTHGEASNSCETWKTTLLK